MTLDDEIKNNIKETLINFRKANGLTQEETANALNMKDSSTYRSWETGRSSPKSSMIVRIAKMYNISTDRILTGEQTRNTSKRLSLSANINEYNKDIYGDEYLSELTSSEKLFIMKFRQLTSKDKQKVADLLNDILPEL